MSSPSRLFSILLILFSLFFLYGFSLRYEFIYDDWETIVLNPSVQKARPLLDYFTNPKTISHGSHLSQEIYRPFKTLSTLFDYQVWGDNPFGFRLSNLLFHFIACLFLFKVLSFYISSEKIKLLGTLFFALHPSLTHNVAYISSRADILCLIFLLLAFSKDLQNENPSLIPKGLFPFVLALFSKETALLYPIIFAYHYFSQKKKIPPSIFIYCLTGFTFFLMRSLLLGTLAQTSYHSGSFILTQVTMMKSWFLYLVGFLWPFRPEILPGISLEKTLFNPRSMLCLISLLGLALSGWKARKTPYSLGLLWWFLFLLPVANFIPIKALHAWRFAYIPFAGLVLSFCTIMNQNKKLSPWIYYGLTLWIGLFAYQSMQVLPQFKSSEALWTKAKDKYPSLAKPYRVLAFHAGQKSDFAKSRQILHEGLENVGKDHFLTWDLAETYLFEQNFQKALPLVQNLTFRDVMEIHPNAIHGWILCHYHFKDYQRIVKEFDPKSISQLREDSLLLIAHSFHSLNLNKEALTFCRILLQMNPSSESKAYCEEFIREFGSHFSQAF